MNFKTSKTLCIIGALLLALRTIPGIHIISHVGFHDAYIIRIASLICGIIGLYGISKFYQSKNIITNAQISIVIVIIGTILNVAFGWIISSLIRNVVEGTYAGAYAMLSRNVVDSAFITVAAFFARRSLRVSSQLRCSPICNRSSPTLIGAILSIIIIGTPIVWITFLGDLRKPIFFQK